MVFSPKPFRLLVRISESLTNKSLRVNLQLENNGMVIFVSHTTMSFLLICDVNGIVGNYIYTHLRSSVSTTFRVVYQDVSSL